jgi:hypothetical protein
MYLHSGEVFSVEAFDVGAAKRLADARHGLAFGNGIRPIDIRHFVPAELRCDPEHGGPCLNRRGVDGKHCGLHARNLARVVQTRARAEERSRQADERDRVLRRLAEVTGLTIPSSMALPTLTLRALLGWCERHSGQAER